MRNVTTEWTSLVLTTREISYKASPKIRAAEVLNDWMTKQSTQKHVPSASELQKPKPATTNFQLIEITLCYSYRARFYKKFIFVPTNVLRGTIHVTYINIPTCFGTLKMAPGCRNMQQFLYVLCMCYHEVQFLKKNINIITKFEAHKKRFKLLKAIWKARSREFSFHRRCVPSKPAFLSTPMHLYKPRCLSNGVKTAGK